MFISTVSMIDMYFLKLRLRVNMVNGIPDTVYPLRHLDSVSHFYIIQVNKANTYEKSTDRKCTYVGKYLHLFKYILIEWTYAHVIYANTHI